MYSGVQNVRGSTSKARGRTGPLCLGHDSDSSGEYKGTKAKSGMSSGQDGRGVLASNRIFVDLVEA